MRAYAFGVALLFGCGGAEKDTGDAKPPAEDTAEEPVPVDQAQICADYLACLQVADPGLVSTEQALYGELGSCWADAETAAACEQECTDKLARAADVHTDVPECTSEEPDDAGDVAGRWEFTATATSGDCADTALSAYRIVFRAQDPETLRTDLLVTLLTGGVEDTLSFEIYCPLAGVEIGCDATPNADASAMVDFAGTYAGDTMTATSTLELATCTIGWELDGVRY
jgi:hypothetical protein